MYNGRGILRRSRRTSQVSISVSQTQNFCAGLSQLNKLSGQRKLFGVLVPLLMTITNDNFQPTLFAKLLSMDAFWHVAGCRFDSRYYPLYPCTGTYLMMVIELSLSFPFCGGFGFPRKIDNYLIRTLNYTIPHQSSRPRFTCISAVSKLTH